MELYKNENHHPDDFDDWDFDDMDFHHMNFNPYYPMYHYYPMGFFCPYCPFAHMHKMHGMRGYERQVNMPPFPGMPNMPNMQGPPTSPPPSFVPNKSTVKSQKIGAKAVDTGSIRPCLYRYTYIWQTNGTSYWTYLIYAGRKSIGGWRWMRFRWVYFGLDLNKIDSFYCI